MRALLVDAAILLLAKEGPTAISIDRVVEVADVARGTFYNYFSSPGELIQAVGTELSEDLISTVNRIVRLYDDPAVRVSVGIRGIFAYARASPMLAAIVMRSGWPVAAPDHALHRLVARDIVLGIKSRRFRARSPQVAMALVGGLAVGVMPEFAHGSVRPEVDVEVAETLLLGLGLVPKEAAKIARVPFNPVRPDGTGLLARLIGDAGAE
jgi:AcrR family transcriptional regulator